MKGISIYCGLAAASLAAIALPARAVPAVTYTSQNRSVSEQTEVASSLDQTLVVTRDNTQSAPDFGPFDGSVQGLLEQGVDPVGGNAEDQASQHSVLSLNQITDRGSLLADDGNGNDVQKASATSQLTVKFDVAQSTNFALGGNVSVVVNRDPTASKTDTLDVTLSDASGNLVFAPIHFQQHAQGPDFISSKTLAQTGVLQPGVYAFSVTALDDAGFGERQTLEFNVTLSAGTAAAIPLPPAAYASLPVLSALSLLGIVRRRRMVVS